MLRTIRWRIALPYVILILLSMAGLTLYVTDQARQARIADLQRQMISEARLMADVIGAQLAAGPSAPLDDLVQHWAALTRVQVTVIGADGTIIGDSHTPPQQTSNQIARPEVATALAAGQGSSIRPGGTTGTETLFVAVPIVGKGTDQAGTHRPLGVVRLAIPLHQVESRVSELRQALLATTLLIALLAVGLAILIAERIVRPIHQLTEVAGRVAAGDLNARLFATTRGEIGVLARAFNHMADQLRSQVTTLAEERGRLEAVLTHMADGVIITDQVGRVRQMNPAAARILGTTVAEVKGRSFAQAVRHHEIIEIWQQCRQRNEEQEEVIAIGRLGLFLRVVVTPFQESNLDRSGFVRPGLPDPGQDEDPTIPLERHPDPSNLRNYLVILQDLTQLRRLETTRRDFVANISHELRTPLAGLKALVDTLRDGALDDPPAAQRFLDRIEMEVDALTQMVQELLELSRIESGQVPLRLTTTRVVDVILPPVERLQPQADRAGLHLTIDLPPDLPPVLADAERVQQVVGNLVHNAIKFTPASGQITIRAHLMEQRGRLEKSVVIEVADTGVGIPEEALSRIFERFYKADRARSGGGTGLGLAIAKHIVQAHGGRIWAESVEGRGSRFFFSLPAVE